MITRRARQALGPAYGIVVLTDAPLPDRGALFVMSELGPAIRDHAILARYGFDPFDRAD